AQRLDRHSRMTVVEAQHDQPLLVGHAYVAPGGRHLRVVRSGARWHCRLGDDDPVRRHRPSVDVLFESVAAHAGGNASAALLTGMGDDGARGLLALRKAGASTFAQDEASSVVWGMPGAAVALGAAAEVLPLSQIAHRLLAVASNA
ncbi:MAG: CheB methylesterase domain-containing protein, partial [Lysobacter sp.]